MKTIGLLGGMSWESTLVYYRAINQGVKEALGGLHSAQIALVSVDFAPLEKLQHEGDWSTIASALIRAGKQIEAAGADVLLICTNTMHKVAADIERAVEIPLLHIADAAAELMRSIDVNRVGLLATRFTMEEDFYTGRLSRRHGIEVLVPALADREVIHRVIFEELCLGITSPGAKQEFLRIIDDLHSRGAQAIVLGCTEIGMLIGQSDTEVLLLDTTVIHVQKAVEYALSHD